MCILEQKLMAMRAKDEFVFWKDKIMSFNKYENVLLDEAEDGIAVLTINRPKALNALNLATLQDIGDALR